MEKVDILLSVYKPNEKYLIEQLVSLNNQDYPNIEVIINDDCPDSPCDRGIFETYLTKVPYRILEQDKKNLNYTKSFEKLVKASTGDYIAFCDQDDVWFSNKISKSVKTLEKENALLVASDRQIIDGDGNVIVDKYRDEHHGQTESWHTGDDITVNNLIITHAVGMVLVVRGEFARSTVPFSVYTGHDKWIISCASQEGRVAFIDEPLVQYRRHGHNVSGVLIGIESKKDYEEKRVLINYNLIQDFLNKYPDFKDKDKLLGFATARKDHKIKDLYKYRSIAPNIAKFDIMLVFVPDFLFKTMILFARKLR